MNAALRQLAVPYEAFDGAVTFYMLPFRNVQTNVREGRLNAITPHFLYTHRASGEQVYVEPVEHALAIERKEDSEWDATDLWGAVEYNFTSIEPLTVGIEFAPFTDLTLPDVQALAWYWQNAPQEIQTRWEAFQQSISIRANNVWVDAKKHAEASRFTAPPEPPKENESSGEEPDPLSSSAGKTTAPDSNDRSNE